MRRMTPHERPPSLTRAVLFLCGVASVALAATAQAAPNVVLVITDDQGYGDLSCHGNPILKTPNLDQLHSESVRLTNFHVSPTCSPTRAALMSSHYSNRTGVWHTIMGRSLLREGETTLGEAFASGGYATGMFGKWHLGDNYPFRPEDRGFGRVVRHGGGGVGQTPDIWDNAYFNDTYLFDGAPKKALGYCTDVFFEEAKQFIKQSVDQRKPFFAYIATNAPHSPLHCPEQYVSPYRDKVSPVEATFFGMIANIDQNVGSLRAWLKEQGLAQDTIFIFMTDNGSAFGASVHNSGMRGHKGSCYDGGHRVPCFVHWPAGGMTNPADIERLCSHIDILPTLQDLCGLPPLEDYVLDGRSLAPLLRDPKAPWPERTIVTDSQRVPDPIKWRQSSTMTERWRLINGVELYDILVDPAQSRDLAAARPEIVEQLRSDYEAWWRDISPSFTEKARIVVGHPAENPSRLTCHDWLVEKGGVPWSQGTVRSAHQGTGYWALRVEAAGDYRVTLRRWPPEVSRAIVQGLPPGKPVPGLEAFRETTGVAIDAVLAELEIAGKQMQARVQPDDEEVTFDIQLPSGDAELRGRFVLRDGDALGAYYALVEKID